MKIIIDDKIPYIRGVFEPFGEVHYLSGAATTPDIARDADALITRTRTICNQTLLENSSVKFIATATIGYDHIDTNWCKTAGIEWTNAPGCNSSSVEQYVLAAILYLARENGLILKGKTLGVVGVGNVGSKVARVGQLLGMNVLLNDPPRERAEGKGLFTSLEHILEEADIITLHVPLLHEGTDKTVHLANRDFFKKLKRNPIFINTCRGEVTNTAALKEAIEKEHISGAIIDCWENEPHLDPELMRMVDIATPHIAGYSRDGKANGTTMCVQAISRFFNLGIDNWNAEATETPANPIITLDENESDLQKLITQAVLTTHPIGEDHERLLHSPQTFEKQRGDYPVRREYRAYTINGGNAEARSVLEKLGFKVE